jgi:prolyl-tRNA synthetase
MYGAYERIFTRCGLDFSIVEAEAGPIGGSASHEFMVNCESGEDTILTCPATGYAANVEKCETGPRAHSFEGEPSGELEKVHTPDCPGIEDVCKMLKVKPRHMLKSVVFQAAGEGASQDWVIAVVPGDKDVNEGKVRNAAGFAVQLADEAEARAAGFVIGYVSPIGASKMAKALVLIDPDAAQGMDGDKGKPMFWATGADEQDYHVKRFNWVRELGDALGDSSRVRVADVRNAEAGDPSPRDADAKLEARRGIEVGHIFKLGDKYSRAMDFSIMDEKQERRPVVMGCYGIGVSRTLAACVEMSHDENGIVWPMALAPYHVLITVMKADDSNAMGVAEKLGGELGDAGFDVLIDDRDERAGVKFKDADLIGVPIRLTIGDKALAEDSVEFKLRTDSGKGELVKLGDVVGACEKAAG